MYQTGTYENFESRLHSLATGEADLTTFAIEANSYGATDTYKTKWNREFRHIHFEIAGEWSDADYVS